MSEKVRKCEFRAHEKDAYKKGYCYEVMEREYLSRDVYKVEDMEGFRHEVSPENIRFLDTAEHYAPGGSGKGSGFIKHEKGFSAPDIEEKYGTNYSIIIMDDNPVIAIQAKDGNGQHWWHVRGDEVNVDEVSHYAPFIMPKN